MISVVVSSYKEEDFLKFEISLKRTIGVSYELIKIENSNKFSLSKAYNLGSLKAQFDILLFVHEDVTFDSKNWGQTLLSLFEKNQNLGIVGVAGALKKSFLPTGWGTGTAEFDRINLIQVSNGREEFQSTKKANQVTEMIKVLDGVFIATTKEIWEDYKFDESISGYHLYDIDFSLRVTQKFQGLISYEILIKHYSAGNYNTDWVQMTLEYHNKEEKKILFDQDNSYLSKSRRAWYKALTFGDISIPQRVEFMDQMGYDLLSIVHAFSFRVPVVGRRIFYLLSKVGL